MKKIELFERAIAEQAGSLKEYGINGTMFWVYRKSLDADNDEIVEGQVCILDENVMEFEKKVAFLEELLEECIYLTTEDAYYVTKVGDVE